jgi:hypothetical protein
MRLSGFRCLERTLRRPSKYVGSKGHQSLGVFQHGSVPSQTERGRKVLHHPRQNELLERYALNANLDDRHTSNAWIAL